MIETSLYILVIKVENDVLVGKLSVYSSKRIRSAFYIRLVLVVEVDLQETLAIELVSDSLSGNLGGVHNILENGIVNGRQCARARTGSTGFLVAVVRLAQNGALCNDEDVTSRKFLFEFADQSLVNLIEGFS